MSYLKFDTSLMTNLEYSLHRNVLRTNRKGAYQTSSISGCNTSKYHGLLVMPIPFLDDDNHLILASFDETVIQHGAAFNLGIHKYAGDTYNPKGHKYIREYNCDGIPKTIYRIGGVVLSKEILFSSKENRLMIRYKLLDAHSQTTMRFSPFLAFRNISQLTKENEHTDKSFREVENGISTCMYYGYPELYMQFSKKPEFVYYPCWNKGIEYIQDQQKGDTYTEDQYVPGYFELSIEKGETIIFSAGDILQESSKLNAEFDSELNERTPRSCFYNCLKNSSHQFYYKPTNNETYLLAGYPWFKIRARDLFISLPGCTISVDRSADFESIMDSAIPHIKDFMEEKPLKNVIKQIEDPDVLLWLIWALQQYWKNNKEIFSKYIKFLFSVIDYIFENKHQNLVVDEQTQLLSTYGRKKAVSWMNATINGAPVIPRSGYLVEFNSLWYNALKFAQEVAESTNNGHLSDFYNKKSERVKDSFTTIFLNEHGYLYDYVDESYSDISLRPNMLFAVSLDYSPLETNQQKTIIDYITKELLSNSGIRSLTPKSGDFRPRYCGTIKEKEFAYFNGLSFPWLIGPYIEAYLKIFGQSGIFLADRLMIKLEDEMQNDCMGAISEFYDSTAPFFAGGGWSFAMSVAEVLRAKRLIESYEQNSM